MLYPIDDGFDRQWGWAVVFKQDISFITTKSTLYLPFFSYSPLLFETGHVTAERRCGGHNREDRRQRYDRYLR